MGFGFQHVARQPVILFAGDYYNVRGLYDEDIDRSVSK